MLKTTRLFGLSAPKVFKAENNEVVKAGGKADKTVVDSSKSKKLKNEKSEILTCFENMGKPMF